MKDAMVKITAERYLSLLEAENELNGLDCAGVDNWIGYGQQHEYMEDEEELIKEVDSKIIKEA